jgi:hypothetical protein
MAEVTKREATRALNALKAARYHPEAFANPPVLMRDWDWLGHGNPARWSIVWEEGPFEWAHMFPFGGIEEEFGMRIKDVSDRMPEGVHSEAITSWAVALVRW